MPRFQCELDPPHAGGFGKVRWHNSASECAKMVREGAPRMRVESAPVSSPPPALAASPPPTSRPQVFFELNPQRDTSIEPAALPPDERARSVGAAIAAASNWRVSKEKTVQFVKTIMALIRVGFKTVEDALVVDKPFKYDKIAVYAGDEGVVGDLMQGPVTTFCKEVLRCETLEEAERAIDSMAAIQIFGILAVEMGAQAVTQWPKSEAVRSWKQKAEEAKRKKAPIDIEAEVVPEPAAA